MKAGRFIVRISRWMARSLHELAARIERWSGAASTPPPAAPPLPDPALQALAERFPGAPEHWLRMVAGRMGLNAVGAMVGSSRTPPSRRSSARQSDPHVPASDSRQRWSLSFGFGRNRRNRSGSPRSAQQFRQNHPPAEWREADEPAHRPVDGQFIAGGHDLSMSEFTTSAYPPSPKPKQREPGLFTIDQRMHRPAPIFPASSDTQDHPEPDHRMTANNPQLHTDTRFPDTGAGRPRRATTLPPPSNPGNPAFPTIASNESHPTPTDQHIFTPIGGEWRSGYEVRQPGELRNIWPELPPHDLTIPDAEPMLPDEEAIRLEQMVTRWSA